MSKITKKHINIIRDYLLSFDEGVRNNILNNISTPLLNSITIIENGFINDESIDKIYTDIGFAESNEDLLNLRNEYFISLAQISLENGSNSDLDRLKISKNQSFQKLLNEMANDESFEKDMKFSLKLHQREEMKKKFQQLDEEDEFELSDKEMRAAITSVERESMKKRFKAIDKGEERSKVFKLITRYAIAASMIGVLIGGYYFNFFNKVELIDNSIVANVEIPNLIESSESNKPIILDKGGSGFAKNRSIFDSITIKQNGLSRQIDTLQNMLENLKIENKKPPDLIQSQIIRQIDSLQALLNTYTFNSSTKKAILNLPKVTVIENIISINRSNLSKFYIKIQGSFYQIETNTKPVNLVRVVNTSLVDSLKMIEFLNE